MSWKEINDLECSCVHVFQVRIGRLMAAKILRRVAATYVHEDSEAVVVSCWSTRDI